GGHEGGGGGLGDAARAGGGAQIEGEVEEGLDEDDLDEGRADGDERLRCGGEAEAEEDEVGDGEAGAEEAEREELRRRVGALAALQVDAEALVELVDAVEEAVPGLAGVGELALGPGARPRDAREQAEEEAD